LFFQLSFCFVIIMGCRLSRSQHDNDSGTSVPFQRVQQTTKDVVGLKENGNANTNGSSRHQNGTESDQDRHDVKNKIPEIDCRELKALKLESLQSEGKSVGIDVERALVCIRLAIVKIVGYGAHGPVCPSSALCSEGVRFSLEAHRLLLMSGMEGDRCASLLVVGSKVLSLEGGRAAVASAMVATMEGVMLDAMQWKHDRVEALEAEIDAVFGDRANLKCDSAPAYSLVSPPLLANILA
jgi:hypothetical protein